MRPLRSPQQAPVLRRSLPRVVFVCVSLPNDAAESGFSNSTRSAPRSVSRVRKPSHRGWGLLDLHAGVLEDYGVAIYLEVLAPEHGDAVGVVVLRVALVAYPEVRSVHHARHARGHLPAVQALVFQVAALATRRIRGSLSAKSKMRSNFSRSLRSRY